MALTQTQQKILVKFQVLYVVCPIFGTATGLRGVRKRFWGDGQGGDIRVRTSHITPVVPAGPDKQRRHEHDRDSVRCPLLLHMEDARSGPGQTLSH